MPFGLGSLNNAILKAMDKKPKDLIYFDEAVEFPKHIKAMEDKIKAVLARCGRLCPENKTKHEYPWGFIHRLDFNGCVEYHLVAHCFTAITIRNGKIQDSQIEVWYSLLSLGVQSPAPDENGLLPCPFCGGKAKIEIVLHGFSHESLPATYFPTCTTFRCPMQNAQEDSEIGGVSVDWPTKEGAIAAWNTRAHAPSAGKDPEKEELIESNAHLQTMMENQRVAHEATIEMLKLGHETKSAKLIEALENNLPIIRQFRDGIDGDIPLIYEMGNSIHLLEAALAAYKGKEGK